MIHGPYIVKARISLRKPAAVGFSEFTTDKGKVGKTLHYVFSYLYIPFDTVEYKLN